MVYEQIMPEDKDKWQEILLMSLMNYQYGLFRKCIYIYEN